MCSPFLLSLSLMLATKCHQKERLSFQTNTRLTTGHYAQDKHQTLIGSSSPLTQFPFDTLMQPLTTWSEKNVSWIQVAKSYPCQNMGWLMTQQSRSTCSQQTAKSMSHLGSLIMYPSELGRSPFIYRYMSYKCQLTMSSWDDLSTLLQKVSSATSQTRIRLSPFKTPTLGKESLYPPSAKFTSQKKRIFDGRRII